MVTVSHSLVRAVLLSVLDDNDGGNRPLLRFWVCIDSAITEEFKSLVSHVFSVILVPVRDLFSPSYPFSPLAAFPKVPNRPT